MAQAIDKKEVYDLVDQLQPDQLPVAATLLRSMLQTDVDDEPATEEDLQRLRDGKAVLDQPEKWSSMEEVLADFGLTMDDFPLSESMATSLEDDDEPVTEEDIQRLREARAALARGEKGTPMEEFMAALEITTEDLAAMK